MVDRKRNGVALNCDKAQKNTIQLEPSESPLVFDSIIHLEQQQNV